MVPWRYKQEIIEQTLDEYESTFGFYIRRENKLISGIAAVVYKGTQISVVCDSQRLIKKIYKHLCKYEGTKNIKYIKLSILLHKKSSRAFNMSNPEADELFKVLIEKEYQDLIEDGEQTFEWLSKLKD